MSLTLLSKEEVAQRNREAFNSIAPYRVFYVDTLVNQATRRTFYLPIHKPDSTRWMVIELSRENCVRIADGKILSPPTDFVFNESAGLIRA